MSILKITGRNKCCRRNFGSDGLLLMRNLIFIFVLLWPSFLPAQELFPLSEPASNIPRGTLGVRAFSETYKEVNQWRNMSALRLMYGATPRLSIYLTGLASNHHGEKMPVEFPFHNTPERGAFYPYRFNGVHIYAKYRFFSLDGPNSHLRAAAYGEAAYVNTTHHEAEPDIMMGDTKGLGGGIIVTYLKKKFAVSLTAGGIFPAKYEGLSPDPIFSLPDVPVRVQYGKALAYSLSFGYLLLPFTYKNYDQTNLNLYLEFRGKHFGDAAVDIFANEPNEYYLGKERYPPALRGATYFDVSPGLQFIVKSNLRIDLSATFRGAGYSYARLYPVYTLGIQRYFSIH